MPILQTEIPLPASPPARYTGMAYDGAHFYLTKECGNEICRYSRLLEPECCLETCRGYSSICYDPGDGCFWASSHQCREVLFKLNRRFQEIDCIPASVPGYCGELGNITGVSCGRGRLIAAYPCGLVSVSKCREEENALLVKSDGEWFLGVLSVCPYLVCRCVVCGRQVIRLYSLLGELLEEYEWTCADTAEAAVFLPCREGLRLAVLVSRRGCYSYLWDCALPCRVPAEPGCLCGCPACGPEPGCCGEPGRGDACPDLLECTAQLEKAIAHILSAEGDKLKKQLESAEDPAGLLQASRSVQTTLVQAARLEQTLFDLLAELQENGEGKR